MRNGGICYPRCGDVVPMTPGPQRIDEDLRELCAAKDEERRRDARLPFEEKIAIVLELQEVSALVRGARALKV